MLVVMPDRLSHTAPAFRLDLNEGFIVVNWEIAEFFR